MASLRNGTRRAYNTARHVSRRKPLLKGTAAITIAAATTVAYSYYSTRSLHTEAPDETLGTPQLDYSQHAQISMSWEKPGLYAWGSNKKGVADPSSADSYTKAATRITKFDGMALRDLKMNEDMGVAVLDTGDVYQWGHSYFGAPVKRKKGVPVTLMDPEVTLRGKNIKKVELGAENIYCLSQSGEVFVLPFSRDQQQNGEKVTESRWMGLSSAKSDISYRMVESDLTKGDKIVDIASGLEHVVLMSQRGSVLSASTSSSGNARGQLGLSRWSPSIDGHKIISFPVTGFRSSKIVAIAAGDQHSIVLDEDGEVFTFGANAHGQLAFDFNSSDTSDVANPTVVSVAGLYPRNYSVKCLKIAGGGKNTFMVVQNQQYGKPYPQIDIWAAGMGQFGQLGNNTWNHYQSKPVRVKVISGLAEWNETENKVSPIGVHSLSVGSSHVICCLDNYSKVDADAAMGKSRTSFHEVNYGRDVFAWGQNDAYQIGAGGKRNNRSMPEYIAPMEQSATDMALKSGWEEEGHKRFQLTPSKVIEITSSTGKRVKRNVEQAIIAGDKVSACFMKLVD
ncbi:Putative uncharacterized protein [Taphrina deformans PYCC 5710]|uniref:Mitochondrial protein Fmp25 n=1 Tax=Taphrina deformans (strain PYCC 5710 / ATCC 11124 / CBS 356.35 / IMI 108563 / JCM 9778 / NBRC 8474) TaxID=1097556 RepID=R4XBG9_TAPDE|nr:Putative uncharacterized protein [Taphrina deformans PYCC 5710]|eukprot:CCG80683.1 Putative uncharacterized protein [Taphrina deformans PYCC 5710]